MTDCARCGTRLIPCYPGQTLHPMCDPNPATWTAAQLAEWQSRVDARKTAEKQQR